MHKVLSFVFVAIEFDNAERIMMIYDDLRKFMTIYANRGWVGSGSPLKLVNPGRVQTSEIFEPILTLTKQHDEVDDQLFGSPK